MISKSGGEEIYNNAILPALEFGNCLWDSIDFLWKTPAGFAVNAGGDMINTSGQLINHSGNVLTDIGVDIGGSVCDFFGCFEFPPKDSHLYPFKEKFIQGCFDIGSNPPPNIYDNIDNEIYKYINTNIKYKIINEILSLNLICYSESDTLNTTSPISYNLVQVNNNLNYYIDNNY